jgi:hypothetical protein
LRSHDFPFVFDPQSMTVKSKKEQSPDAIGDQAASHCPRPVKAIADSR